MLKPLKCYPIKPTEIVSAEVIAAAQAHAIEAYPEEACGLVVAGAYHRCANRAKPADAHRQGGEGCECRLCTFSIDPRDELRLTRDAPLEAVIHSHPGGPYAPSERDMQGQMATRVPWGIIVVDAGDDRDLRVSEPIFWGDQLPMAPLLGRVFLHGVHDCYSLIRDTFRLGREELARQDITREWPYEPHVMEDVARSDGWWLRDDRNLYQDLFEPQGFRQIEASEVRPGDGFLAALVGEKLGHGGLYIGGNLILHHKPRRLSVREPIGNWTRTAVIWLRFTLQDEGGEA